MTLHGTLFQERFPDPSALAKHLHNNGFKAIWMLDPGIKQEEGFDVYDSGSKNNVWVKGADGEPFIGNHSLVMLLMLSCHVKYNTYSNISEVYVWCH